MKVLLYQDVDKLGYIGDVVEVKSGYARNYLLPQGIAKPATQGNMRSIAEAQAKGAEKRIAERKRLEIEAEKVEGAEAVVAAKANEQGHLFGSVSEKDIAANLREQGFSVADSIVRLSEHIKDVGAHEVTLRFAADVTATVTVTVVPEASDEAEAEADGDGKAEDSWDA